MIKSLMHGKEGYKDGEFALYGDDGDDEYKAILEEKKRSVFKMTVCVIATDKGTGFIQTCTSCDEEDAQKYAKYYRSVGYNARVLTYEELEKYQEWEKEERMMTV